MTDSEIDRVQKKVMQAMRGSNISPEYALNVMLSIALSIAKEIDNEPIARINKQLEELSYWQYKNEDDE